MPDYDPLWYWVREREQIRLRRERGEPPPWTKDPILAHNKFCNVRREDDRVTIWIRENIRRPFADHRFLWLMLCIARQINWPPTLAELIANDAWPSHPYFKPTQITNVLAARQKRGEKVYTGAYVISAPPTQGVSKNAYIAERVIGELWRWRGDFPFHCGLKRTHQWLAQFLGWGNFMAYQAVVDMQHTALLNCAGDRGIWAAAGPGTIRGLNRLHGRELKYSLSQAQALDEVRAIDKLVREQTGVAMEFSDVTGILCEVDKYLRLKYKQGKLRSRYVPPAPGFFS